MALNTLLRGGLVAVLAAGMSFGMSGCITPLSEAELRRKYPEYYTGTKKKRGSDFNGILSVVNAANAGFAARGGNPGLAAGFDALSRAQALKSQRQHEVDVAREGRGDVNVVVGGNSSIPADDYSPLDLMNGIIVTPLVQSIGSCREFEDLNSNGRIEDNETIGGSRTYFAGDRIVAYIQLLKPLSGIEGHAYDDSGNLIASGLTPGFSINSRLEIKKGLVTPGNYRIVWESDDKFVGSLNIGIK